jgi:AcrR family transcriptional regulator
METNPAIRRIVRPPTAEERERYRQAVREELAGMGANKAVGRELRKRHQLTDAVTVLRARREELGISLAELSRRAGMPPATLSGLESPPIFAGPLLF